MWRRRGEEEGTKKKVFDGATARRWNSMPMRLSGKPLKKSKKKKSRDIGDDDELMMNRISPPPIPPSFVFLCCVLFSWCWLLLFCLFLYISLQMRIKKKKTKKTKGKRERKVTIAQTLQLPKPPWNANVLSQSISQWVMRRGRKKTQNKGV